MQTKIETRTVRHRGLRCRVTTRVTPETPEDYLVTYGFPLPAGDYVWIRISAKVTLDGVSFTGESGRDTVDARDTYGTLRRLQDDALEDLDRVLEHAARGDRVTTARERLITELHCQAAALRLRPPEVLE